jgi:hypothetical protein
MFAFKKCLAGLFTVACITSAQAVPVTLDFTLPDLVPNVPEAISNYYAGGTDAGGAVGPNYGISFFGGDLGSTTEGGFALIDTTNPPSPQGGNVLVYPLPAGGETTSFLVDTVGTTYLSYNFLGQGLDSIGVDPSTLSSSTSTPLGSGWTHEDLTFNQPVFTFVYTLFGGSNEYANEFANITRNGASPGVASVPEHTGWGTYGLAGLGLLGMCWVFRKREKAIIG